MLLGLRGQEHDGYFPRLWLVAQLPQDGEPVAVRKHDVENDQVRLLGGRDGDGGLRVVGLEDLVSGELEVDAAKEENVRLVVHHEDTHGQSPSSECCRRPAPRASEPEGTIPAVPYDYSAGPRRACPLTSRAAGSYICPARRPSCRSASPRSSSTPCAQRSSLPSAETPKRSCRLGRSLMLRTSRSASWSSSSGPCTRP